MRIIARGLMDVIQVVAEFNLLYGKVLGIQGTDAPVRWLGESVREGGLV